MCSREVPRVVYFNSCPLVSCLPFLFCSRVHVFENAVVFCLVFAFGFVVACSFCFLLPRWLLLLFYFAALVIVVARQGVAISCCCFLKILEVFEIVFKNL